MEDAARWSKLDELLDSAIEQAPEDRPAWLARVCGDDVALRKDLERLIALAQDEGPLLRPAGAFAGPLWEELAEEIASGQAARELRAGETLGPYRIDGVLGRGGVGTVYRAWDPKLERPVAVKALSRLLGEDAASLRRFEREAKLLASLSHPSVASIYELLWVEDRPYLVLELVEGESLAERLTRGPLALRETLDVGLALAQALEEAHRNGVIHRDLKPSNVMLSAGGRVKVLDFGLAKVHGPPGDNSAGHGPSTSEGVVLGTPAYMSPEQARGEEVDRRTDVWALGCILYEALTARRAFSGETVSEAFAAVLRDEVDWSRLPAETPKGLRRLIARCLRKDPRERMQDIGDARLELEELRAEGEAGAPERSLPAGLGRALAGLIVAGVVAFLIARWFGARRDAAPVVRASLPLGSDVRLWIGASHSLALSPNGQFLAFVGESGGRSQLFVRALANETPRAVRNSEDARAPFFSFDGRFVAFFAQGELRKASVEGGNPERVAAAGIEPRGASWAEDGTIAFAQTGAAGIFAVDAKGGEPRLISRVDAASGEVEHLWPEWLPSGALLLTVRLRAAQVTEELAVLDKGQTRPRRLRPGAQAVYARNGHLVYARNGGLEAVRFDAGRREIAGSSVPLLDSLQTYPQGAASFAIARSGSFVYLPERDTATLAWVASDGAASPADAPPGTPGWPRLAPDGRRAAIHVGRPAKREIWLIDLQRPRAFRQLTFGGGGFPVWSPDGQRIAFASRRDGPPALFVVDADGDAPPRKLLEQTATVVPVSWSRDGLLAYYEVGETTQRDLWVLDVERGGKPVSFLATPANELSPVFSPDGRYIAYVSNETGRNEVYLRPYPPPGAVVAVSSGGGSEPAWSADGRRLYFRRENALVAVDVTQRPRLALGSPRPVLETEMVANAAGNPGYDVRADGRAFLMLRAPVAASVEPLRLVLNWLPELEARFRPPAQP